MTDSAATTRNIFSNFILGLKVLFSEIQWLGLLWLRRQEARQLEKRLAEEQTSLGAAVAAHLAARGPVDPGKDPLPALDNDSLLAYKQVRFLRQELDHLHKERASMRQDFVARRKQRLGLS